LSGTTLVGSRRNTSAVAASAVTSTIFARPSTAFSGYLLVLHEALTKRPDKEKGQHFNCVGGGKLPSGEESGGIRPQAGKFRGLPE